MVILGGLEIAAVGYLLNEFNKDKIEERERRKQSQHRPENAHHDRPHEDRPHSRPHSNSRPPAPGPYPPQRYDNPQASTQNLLFPPQNQIRPSSAPPQDTRPEWQRQQQQPFPPQGQPQYQPQQMQRPQNGPQGPSHELPGESYPFQSQLWHKQQAQQAQQQRPPQGPPPNQGPNQPPLWQPGPQPGPQGPNQFHNNGPPPQYNNNQNNFSNGPPPPGPGHLQRPQTIQPGQQGQQGPPQPYLPQSQTFPIPNQQQNPQQQFRPNQPSPLINSQNQPPKPPPSGPLVYINTKTGKVSHNLYPVDHPMHRSGDPNFNSSSNNLTLSRSNTALGLEGAGDITMPREFWGDEKYMRTMAGDVHTGLMWSERDEEDLAYGKDYGGDRERRKGGRNRGDSGGASWRMGSYERVRRGS